VTTFLTFVIGFYIFRLVRPFDGFSSLRRAACAHTCRLPAL
jgi:hypothetical protein